MSYEYVFINARFLCEVNNYFHIFLSIMGKIEYAFIKSKTTKQKRLSTKFIDGSILLNHFQSSFLQDL